MFSSIEISCTTLLHNRQFLLLILPALLVLFEPDSSFSKCELKGELALPRTDEMGSTATLGELFTDFSLAIAPAMSIKPLCYL